MTQLPPPPSDRFSFFNTTTQYSMGTSGQLAKEIDKSKIDSMGISECRWTGHGTVKLNNGESVFLSGRHGVAILMTKNAGQLLLEYWGAMALWLEHRTHNRSNPGSKLGQFRSLHVARVHLGRFHVKGTLSPTQIKVF